MTLMDVTVEQAQVRALERIATALEQIALDRGALVVEHVKSVRRNKFTILDPSEHLCRIASRPGKTAFMF